MSNLEQYIKDNREAFDSGELPAGSEERFLKKLQNEQKIASIGKKSGVRYIFRIAGWASAVVLLGIFISIKGGINELPADEAVSHEEYISLMNTLDEEIVEMSKKCDKKTAKEAVKASKSIKKDVVPLEEQLPEELSERERAKILRKYYKEKAEGLKKVKTFLAVQMMEEEE